ncbi:hypothetical protein, partial [Mariniphaga sediminis]|uniref:hypothetical protein n=1 Tax=Mariniphaga sediminis TaxID=1628158 RepID=UPI003562F54E
MKNLVLLFLFFFAQLSFAQISIEKDDPRPKTVPDFYKSKLSDIEAEIADLRIGKSEVIATSPGNLSVYAVYYEEKDDLQRQANYNSAVGARNPVYYAKKDAGTKPVVYFVGPVHG